MNAPFLSIITPSYNQGKYLTEAIQSILSQGSCSIEHIIVDGGSTDCTLDVLRGCPRTYPLQWISEPDRGLYDALNKAIAKTNGEWLGWLNCDDVYPPGTFDKFMTTLREKPDAEIICGDAKIFVRQNNGDDKLLIVYRHYRGDRFAATVQNLKITHLNCCFFRRRLIDQLGEFDTSYRIVSDRDYMFRIMRVAPPSAHVNAVTCRYRSHKNSLTMGGSSSSKGKDIMLKRSHPHIPEIVQLCERHRTELVNPRIIRAWCSKHLAGIYASEAAASLLAGDLGRLTELTRCGLHAHACIWFYRFSRSLARQSLEKIGLLSSRS